MALQHAKPGETVDVRPFGARLPGQQSTALFKSGELEVLRLVLLAGKGLPPHKLAGEITIQCLEGSVRIETAGTARLLEAGRLLYLSGSAVHDLVAIEDASVLVTIALRR